MQVKEKIQNYIQTLPKHLQVKALEFIEDLVTKWKQETSIDLKDPWLEIPITSWPDFDEKVNEFNQSDEWYFRGQTNVNWHLRTSLDRYFEKLQKIISISNEKVFPLTKKAKEALELRLIYLFQHDANLYLEDLKLEKLPPIEKRLEWLAIMQHYGVPTRLLDVTQSPYVAAFFALESGSSDTCVYAIKPFEVETYNKILITEANYEEVQNGIFSGQERFISVFPNNIEKLNERQRAQNGWFLVPSQIAPSFDDLLKDYQDFADSEYCIKYIIPAKLRLSGLERLRQKNITSAKLFPGIDGFSRSLKFQVLETIQSQIALRQFDT